MVNHVLTTVGLLFLTQCWEVTIGAEFYKLAFVNFFVVVVATVFTEALWR